MMILVTGGSGSGKSAFAEDCIVSFGKARRIYIATMYPFDEESKKRVKRHQAMRQGKGFDTLECYTGLARAAVPEGSTVLLECMSNLVANEMFAENKIRLRDEVTAQILDGIEALNRQLEHLLIVTNNVFEDGISYEETTAEYIEAMGQVNERLAAMADTHFSVEKGVTDGRTFTHVRRLNRAQRRQELARLTGGSHVSQTMLDGAEELLAQAEAFRAEL